MRKLDNWIGGFLDYSAGKKSPEIFRLWSGISAVAAALQRRCWSHILETDLFPNMFVLLVADPGIGKSMAIRAAREVVREDTRIKLSPQRVTKEAFYDEIEACKVSTVDLTKGTAFDTHSLTAMIDEFGVFVRRGDLDFMADLADLYDSPDPFEYVTKHSGKIRLRRSWFNFISGCTPQWLRESFTEIALEQGFPSRIIAVYSDESFTPTLFGRNIQRITDKNNLLSALREDLNEILQLEGEFTWEDDAAERFQKWVNSGMKPYPPDPRLKHYNTRRVIHVPKLAMVISASRRSTLTITLDDYLAAQRILLETESRMHEAYAAVSKNPYFQAVENVVKLVIIEYHKNKTPVAEHKVRRALEREVPYYLVLQIMEQLVGARRLLCEGTAPTRVFYPNNADGGDLGSYGTRPEDQDGSTSEGS